MINVSMFVIFLYYYILQDNIDTLGKEIAKLTMQHQQK